ncbi:unnamed protein product [Fraxinus pennsylvanica]|uniref:Uncharacterized protein n=1 Tax=Fraxinus pennsylvanica TaxID=56036 RepID=A0AAD2DU56_9LAMI|nr:unnamed protein product [Fraxinus pennsylvanica]
MMSTVEKKKEGIEGRGLIDVVFSWSIEEVMNKDLYKNKVEPIPETFYTAEHYLQSFNDPLLEETHASLRSSFTPKSRPPAREIFDVNPDKDFRLPKDLFYTMTLKRLRSGSEEDKRVYEPEVGDLIALTNVRPEYIEDLTTSKRPYIIKVLDILPSDEISKLAKKLDSVLGKYTADHISNCLFKQVEQDLVLPMTWPVNTDVGNVPSGSDPVQELASQVAAISIRDEPGV